MMEDVKKNERKFVFVIVVIIKNILLLVVKMIKLYGIDINIFGVGLLI